MWGLFKEVFCKYRDDFVAARKKSGFKKNLALIFFLAAGVVLCVVLYEVLGT